MKQRLFYNWTFTRVAYVVIGLLVLTQSILMGQWPGIIIGCYFAAMRLFAFGCAAGSCAVGSFGKVPDKELDSNEKTGK